MKIKLFFIGLMIPAFLFSQDAESSLGDFTLSNNSSPAFLLVEETPTSIYTPENLRALAIHALDNLGQSISIEFAPYFFIGKENRTYYNYVGLKTEDDSDFKADMKTSEIKQDIFSGALKTLSISGAYVDKEFAGIGDKRKTYSIGARTTLIRVYSNGSKKRIVDNATSLAKLLADFELSDDAFDRIENAATDEEAQRILKEERKAFVKSTDAQKKFQKTEKPAFRLDGALGYSALFKNNNIDSGTANRFGSWLTAEASLILNAGKDSKTNDYFNLFFTARYVEDEFNLDTEGNFTTNYYRDFGVKGEFEFGRFAISYEYISRNGTIDSERSVGNVKFVINKDISIIGGFGKDFPENDNLITIFGLNLGLNMGDNTVSLK
ncbi:hypothetical protein [Winogradskyella sp. 3972H.M.0a.05]|uniref:hypothetical protein n=1 Tax=Winogradskyella sp. 3972H.M.0a.05 TaxID=2950277 RepID=UPI0033908974